MREVFRIKTAGKDAYFGGDYREAVTCFSEAIKLQLDDPNLYGLRCAAYNKLNMYEEALKDVERMLELRPYNWKGYLMKGSCHFHLNQFDDATEAYGKALQARPNKSMEAVVSDAQQKISLFKQRYNNNPAVSLRRQSAHAPVVSQQDREERLRKFRKYCAALTIQCWWRGYRVRKIYEDLMIDIKDKVKKAFEPVTQADFDDSEEEQEEEEIAPTKPKPVQSLPKKQPKKQQDKGKKASSTSNVDIDDHPKDRKTKLSEFERSLKKVRSNSFPGPGDSPTIKPTVKSSSSSPPATLKLDSSKVIRLKATPTAKTIERINQLRHIYLQPVRIREEELTRSKKKRYAWEIDVKDFII